MEVLCNFQKEFASGKQGYRVSLGSGGDFSGTLGKGHFYVW